MPLTIDIYETPLSSRWLSYRLTWYRLMSRFMPTPIAGAITLATFQYYTLGNWRNSARYLSLVQLVWKKWKQRANNPAYLHAHKLWEEGWRLNSDWPIYPPRHGEPIFGVRLGKNEGNPYLEEKGLEFCWDTIDDARPVPIDEIYDRMELAHLSTEDQLLAWETCFWLTFLTEDALMRAAKNEK